MNVQLKFTMNLDFNGIAYPVEVEYTTKNIYEQDITKITVFGFPVDISQFEDDHPLALEQIDIATENNAESFWSSETKSDFDKYIDSMPRMPRDEIEREKMDHMMQDYGHEAKEFEL